MNERAFLAQLESANPEELAQILQRPSAEQERVLEIYFGAERLQKLRRVTLSARRGEAKGNVVVLHGIMGGEMTVFPPNERSQFIWLNYPHIIIGAVGWLRMNAKFESDFDVRATGILKKWYSEQIIGLRADGWNVQTFWYDWRRDLAQIADTLRQQIDGWFGPDADVHLVAHSMGGLVARTYILRHEKRWGQKSRLIMLGTPNHGSFAIPQVITGAYQTVRLLSIADIKHSERELCDILNGFPGSMQMLPSPLRNADYQRMYDAKQWATWNVPQKILDLALESHQRLAGVVDRARMSYVAGYNKPTKVGVRDWSRLDHADAYTDSLAGDGTVPHELGFLFDKSGKQIPTYFVECSHGDLPNNLLSLEGTKQILASGKCDLPQTLPAKRGPSVAARVTTRRMDEISDEQRLRKLTQRVHGRTRALTDIHEAPVSRDEIEASEILVRNFLGGESTAPAAAEAPGTDEAAPPPSGRKTKSTPVSINIRLVNGRIEEADAQTIAVGHYIGVAPQFAEKAIDVAISQGARGKKAGDGGSENLIITDLCRRGIIVGELAQNFILPDPRKDGRAVVIAGMGRPGTFGEAELTVLARELVWTLGRSRRENLATVLIGAGAGNLETQDAVNAWLRGIRRALYDAQTVGDPRLQTITFVELNAGNFVRLHYALKKARDEFALDEEAPLEIVYRAPDNRTLSAAKRAATKSAAKRGAENERKSFTAAPPKKDEAEPTRLTIQLQADVFQFAALTREASIPQRETRIDPTLVDEANDQLPNADSYEQQLNHGNLLASLLLPDDMRELIQRQQVPIVLALDATTARIHWEMMADGPAPSGMVEFQPEHFLGTVHGLTRQLRTTFAQLPEPPVLTDRPLRVLVVADPDEDAPLPGAQAEGEAVANIFEEFRRRTGRPVEVKRLFGPGQATRIAVLDHLINQRFDMMYYAGHCFFNEKNPPLSGWVFTGGKTLSANELNRIDRIPRFIFSNACESGITPDRADKRNALMAPSFAEAFFARGVANFICTAWPIDDQGALKFAERFYRGILGFETTDGSSEPLHQAMRAARCEIAKMQPGGMETWGAYQHYGDPNLRLIPRGSETSPAAVSATKTKKSRAKKRAKNKKR